MHTGVVRCIVKAGLAWFTVAGHYVFHSIPSSARFFVRENFAALTHKIVKSSKKEKVLRPHIHLEWWQNVVCCQWRKTHECLVSQSHLSAHAPSCTSHCIFFDVLHWKRFAYTDLFFFREKDQKPYALIKSNMMNVCNVCKALFDMCNYAEH